MSLEITIENLRHIKRLKFQVPNSGVWLLTGANGTGKTSILACLRRIGYSNAFPVHFPASQRSYKVDSFEGASVRYRLKNAEVTYRYRGERWVPLPKANSMLLRKANFPSVMYIAADSARIEPKKDEFHVNRIKAASSEIINAANKIFDTDKFQGLKTINLRRGVGNDAFLLEVSNDPQKSSKRYASEKNLSLGELCILKLLRLLKDCHRGSLVLIDELELALHPMAQVSLLNYLEEIAQEKLLTVIVSTHSATLVKHASSARILHLKETIPGEIECERDCFPSLVLGAIAYKEERAVDLIIYVEDDAAQILVEEFINRTMERIYKDGKLPPTYQVIPVGGISNVLRFFVKQRPLLPIITKCHVMLDADAEASLLNALQPDLIRIRDKQKKYISYLPVTPEVGLAKFLHADKQAMISALKAHYKLNISIMARDLNKLPLETDRDGNKALVKKVSEAVAEQIPDTDWHSVKDVMLKIYAGELFRSEQAGILRLIAPLLNR